MRCERGFTLLEIMVVMVLLALLVLGVNGALKIGVDALSLSSQVVQGDRVAMTQSFLRGRIEAALAFKMQNEGMFSGDREQLSFVSTMPERANVYGLQQLGLKVDRGQLILTWHPLSQNHSEAQKVLIPDVRDGEFSYFDGAKQQWFDAWDHAESLPQLVRLRMVSTSGQWTWPDLVIDLEAETDHLVRRGR